MDPKSAFVKRFGDLIALLRADPGNDAAQDLALTAAAAAVETESLAIEAGVQWAVIPDELTLKGRLLARQVEAIRVAAGAEPHELLALARALSHDSVPVLSSPHVEVEMVEMRSPPPSSPPSSERGIAPSPPRVLPRRAMERRAREERRRPGRAHYAGIDRRRRADRRITGERRLDLIAEQRTDIARLHDALGQSAHSLAWDAVLATALALVRLVPCVPEADRRSFGIQVRRAIPRRAIEALVDLAEREAALRDRAGEVLRWIGLDAAEIMLDRLSRGEAAGIRAFYYNVLGGMPGVYPLVTPLLSSRHAHEIRHGAAVLGRLGQPAALDELIPLLAHPDEAVRAACVRAMGEIHSGPSAEPLRQAMHHPHGGTRAAAACAIGVWRGGALALLLVGALETERNREAWQALATALGGLGTVESTRALAGVAMARRGVLRRGGFTMSQRLAAVEALGLADTPAARLALERLADEGEAVVRYAADRILQAERQRAG